MNYSEYLEIKDEGKEEILVVIDFSLLFYITGSDDYERIGIVFLLIFIFILIMVGGGIFLLLFVF